jgi:hypothetical protein
LEEGCEPNPTAANPSIANVNAKGKSETESLGELASRANESARCVKIPVQRFRKNKGFVLLTNSPLSSSYSPICTMSAARILPPSITIVAPVMKLAASDARKMHG